MAADTHGTGTLYLLAGKSITNYRILAALDSEIADNAAGSEPYYLVPAGSNVGAMGLPRNDGIPYMLPSGPHVLPGELLIIGFEASTANAATDIDTTGATSDVYQLTYAEYDFATRTKRVRVIADETQRNTTAGVAPPTDPKVVTGVIIPTHAWGPVPPNSGWTLFGRVRLDLRSAA